MMSYIQDIDNEIIHVKCTPGINSSSSIDKYEDKEIWRATLSEIMQ